MSKSMKAEVVLGKVNKASKERNWTQACELLQQLLKKYPGNARAKKAQQELRSVALPDVLSQAQTHLASKEWADAERHLSAAFFLSRSDLKIGQRLALCMLDMGRAPDAAEMTAGLLENHPADTELLNIKARAHREMSQPEESRTYLLQALELSPEDPKTLNNLGILERSLGKRREAAAYYRRALSTEPSNVTLHQNLSQVVDYSGSERHLDELHAALDLIDRDDPKNAALYFALFKALDEVNRPAEAFEHLEKGNRLAASLVKYDFQKDTIPFALTKALLNNAQALKEPETGSFRPIFITGLPRSGTSLLERIISRAEGVQPCGELTVVQLAVSQLLRRIMDRQDKSLHKEDIAELRSELLTAFGKYSDKSSRLVDKMPLNFRWIGLINAALPEARIIHISRDPIPVAWSLFKHMFQGAGIDFVYREDDIARYMVLHSNYLALWRSLDIKQLIEIRYEDLVSNSELITKQVAQATELQWTENWLTPERATHQVLTASSDQVRKPIYSDSNLGWQRYEPQLAPLQQSLKSVGILA